MRPNIKGCTMAISSKWLELIFPIPEADGVPLWTHDYWISIMLHILSVVVPIDEPLMNYRLHSNNTSGLIERSTKRIFRRKGQYRRKFSSSFINRRIDRLESLSIHLENLSLKYKLPDAPRSKIIRKVLKNEISLLRERCSIWNEKNICARSFRIISFLFKGKYFAFKKWQLQMLKDALGNKNAFNQ